MVLIPNSSLPFSDNAKDGNNVNADVWNQMVQIFQLAINSNWSALLDMGVGTSASQFLGSAPIPGVSGNLATTIYQQMYSLKTLLDATVVGAVPGLATIDPIALNLAYGQQVLSASKKAPYNVLSITGRTLVNLLGRAGLCGVTGKNYLTNATETLDTTNFAIGSGSLKITASGASAEHYESIARDATSATIYNTIQANSYYVALAYLKPNVGQAKLRAVTLTSGFSPVQVLDVTSTDTTKFTPVYIKIATGATEVNVEIRGQVLNASGQAIYTPSGTAENININGFRVFQITQTDYNALGTTLTDANAIATKYPYVDDVKHVNSPYINRIGENMLPTFNEWNLSASTVTPQITSTYRFTATIADLSSTGYYIDCSIIPSQQYTVTVDRESSSGRTRIQFYDNTNTIIGTATYYNQDSVTVTTPSNAVKIRIFFSNETAIGTAINGTFTFTNPRLNIGSVDLGFKPRNDDYLYFPNTTIAGSVDGTVYDQIYHKDGKFWRENRFVRDMVLDGSLVWGLREDDVGHKMIYFSPFPYSTITGTFHTAVKYDGKILIVSDYNGLINASDKTWVGGDNTFNISVADTDSGWGETYSPTAGEMQAYFYGWKLNNGTFGTGYNGTGTKTWTLWNATSNTGSVTVLPTTLATGFTPYKLTYQLATSTLEEIAFEGSISTLEGNNQFEVGVGMIVREKTNPTLVAGGTVPVINSLEAGTNGTNPLKNRLNKALAIYKNGRIDTPNWGTNTFQPYGNYRYTTTIALYDPTATYEVTYLALDTYSLSCNVQTINGEYDTNVKMVVDRTVQNVADIDTRLSVVENNKARKVQGQWIAPTLLNAWVADGIVQYMKDEFGYVHVRGKIKSGTTGVTAFTFPSGYRPLNNESFITVQNNAGTWGIGALDIVASTGSFQVSTVNSGATTDVIFGEIMFLAEQ